MRFPERSEIVWQDDFEPKDWLVPCWQTEAEVTRVIDGDTVEVQIVRNIRVRLKDCWAPETRTRDEDEKRRGKESRRYLEGLIDGRTVLLRVETDRDVGEMLTFGRVVGEIYLNREDIGDLMVRSGHATKKKE
jgi:endonuclease YncB( thermonuclease family)